MRALRSIAFVLAGLFVSGSAGAQQSVIYNPPNYVSSFVVGSPTGGNEGVGTANAEKLYANGSLLSAPLNLAQTAVNDGWSDPGDTVTTANGVCSGTARQATFTTQNFTSANVGQAIFVSGIAAAGANFTGTIASFVSLHVVCLSANAVAGTYATIEADGGTDNTAAINAQLDIARTLAPLTDFTNGLEITCPSNGKFYVGSPLNFTGLGTRQQLKPIKIRGACTIIGVAVSGIIVDALGDAGVDFGDITVYAGLYGGTASDCIQIGRASLPSNITHYGSQPAGNSFHRFRCYGWFSEAALKDFAAETTGIHDSLFYNARSGSGSYGAIFDGINHWNALSTFQTQENAVDTAVSFDTTKLDNTQIQNVGTSGAVWLAGVRGFRIRDGFIQEQGSGGSNFVLYTTVGSILGLDIDTHTETASAAQNFLITGAATPTITGFSFHDAVNMPSTSIFALDSGTTGATFQGFDLKIDSVSGTPTVFDTPSAYTIKDARVFLPLASATMWPTNPGVFNGKFCSGTATSCGIVLANAGAPPSGLRGTFYYDTGSNCAMVTTNLGAQCLSPLASPTFTGTPAAPTAAVDTNTTQVATTAYVVGQSYLKSATAASTYAPLASPSVSGTFTTAGHTVDAGTALSGGDFVFGTGAGTGPTITTTAGSDRRFRVNITTGSSPSASAIIFTLTFKGAYSAAPYCSIIPESAGAGQKITSVFASSTTTTLVLNSDATALTASSVYQWSFQCLG